MNVLILDMEFGEIYGSHYRDFIPTEMGGVIYDTDTERLIVVSRKFLYDGDVVLRKNLTDKLGTTIGFSESVANIKKGEYQKEFDPDYCLNTEDKKHIRKKAYRFLGELRAYLYNLFEQYSINQLILFGSETDLRLFKKANIILPQITIFDIQHQIEQEVRKKISLDRAAKIIKFYVTQNTIGSTHFRYSISNKYTYLIKPHRAVGDACRIFLAYKELTNKGASFIQQCIMHLSSPMQSQLQGFEQLYDIIKKEFPHISSRRSGERCFIIEPSKQPYIQRGHERKCFPFRIKARNLQIRNKLSYNGLKSLNIAVYPYKSYAGEGYYCETIHDVKTLADQYKALVYVSSERD